ncbi:unnamed protein product [Cunninghamella blakesleeana]
MSLTPLRQAAIRSVRQSTVTSRLTTLSVWQRTYSSATDNSNNNNNKEASEETKKPEEEKAPESIEDQLKAQLAEKDKKIAELQDAYLRSLADQENIRERSRKELTSAKEFAIQKFAKDLLDTVDILNMALTSVPEGLRKKDTAEDEANKASINIVDQLTNLYTGVSMTEVELVKTLKRHGVEQHNPDGETFDPNLHQALFQAPMPDKQAGTIFAVQKLGYTIKGRVLRPAQVGVVMESK